jgi:dethiobiotin synthetase
VILFVTGTGTDVGKTVVTAALAACASGRVAVVKLAQTGVRAGEPGDLAEITRLSGCPDVYELARYPDPLSPHHASAMAGAPEYDIGIAVLRIADLANTYDVVLVEGSGGLLVPYDRVDRTIVDIAEESGGEFILVTQAGLGTLNHTALVAEYLDRSSTQAHIVIGSWPAEPGLAERLNLRDLARMSAGGVLAGVVPAGAPALPDFAARARGWLAPEFGGSFDCREFRASVGVALPPQEPPPGTPRLPDFLR